VSDQQAFTRAAEAAAAVVVRRRTRAEAAAYAVDLCAGKQACPWLLAGCDLPLSAAAGAACPEPGRKTLAGPALPPDMAEACGRACSEQGVAFLQQGLRPWAGGLDVGLTTAELGLAATGTLVMDAADEDVRLASMVAEVHVAVLPASRIRADARSAAADLADLLGRSPYAAWITGPSRTADIERKLALGVHGPLALHIVLVEED
jgi:L-lactate dehydrogenase complex protein LldG